MLPRSLYGRLLVLSLVATLAALGVAGVAIGGVLERFVTSTLDERLADKLGALSAVVRQDGTVDTAYARRFDTLVARNADWRVEAPGGTIGSARGQGPETIGRGDDQRIGSIAGFAARPGPRRHGPPERTPADPARAGIALRSPAPPPVPPPAPGPGAQPFDERLHDGERVHGRWEEVPTDRGPARIAVAVSRDLIDRPIRAALVPLALSLLALGGALALAAVVQLRLGLKPLGALRDQVAAIRAGGAQAVSDGQPVELAPLVEELNALAADNRAALGAARLSAANLAHGLKTPVATLRLALAGRDPDGALTAQVARIDATIRRHLARARAEAVDRRAATRLAPAVAGVADAVRRLHDRALTIDVDVPAALTVAVDGNDLDELIGNLVDNAARHARTAVAVRAGRDPADARRSWVTVQDDGPGIPAAARAAATRPGSRLDERGDGHGFGLAIVTELAALYGGALSLDDALGGGLLATLTLPTTG